MEKFWQYTPPGKNGPKVEAELSKFFDQFYKDLKAKFPGALDAWEDAEIKHAHGETYRLAREAIQRTPAYKA